MKRIFSLAAAAFAIATLTAAAVPNPADQCTLVMNWAHLPGGWFASCDGGTCSSQHAGAQCDTNMTYDAYYAYGVQWRIYTTVCICWYHGEDSEIVIVEPTDPVACQPEYRQFWNSRDGFYDRTCFCTPITCTTTCDPFHDWDTQDPHYDTSYPACTCLDA